MHWKSKHLKTISLKKKIGFACDEDIDKNKLNVYIYI